MVEVVLLPMLEQVFAMMAFVDDALWRMAFFWFLGRCLKVETQAF